MTLKEKVNKTWLKAAVLGCLWASSEIVLGSFFHNLRIPFSSSILTGIGLILLISASYKWPEKGLFWRAGLICALMKSISPSAVIFGPMIAIFMESLLLEGSVAIFGRNLIGFMAGSMLAMSWNLIQKIVNYILIYGADIVNLYKDLTGFAQKQLNLQFLDPWMPVLVLLMIYLILGLITGGLAVSLGRKTQKYRAGKINISAAKIRKHHPNPNGSHASFSAWWLAGNILILAASLFLNKYVSLFWWMLSVAGVIALWTYRYRKALRPLMKPKFWTSFFLITMLASFLFSVSQDTPHGLYLGLMTGLEMNVRAALMIVGFATIGTEIRNPKISTLLSSKFLRQLPASLEVAFATLPYVIANLPPAREFIQKPGRVLFKQITRMDAWLEKVSLYFARKPFAFIITGAVGSGKTNTLQKLIENLEKRGLKVGGIVSPAVETEHGRIGYDLLDVQSNRRVILSRIHGETGMELAGRYFFREEGLAFGNSCLAPEYLSGVSFIVLDEIGPMELRNKGWSSALNVLLTEQSKPLILVARNTVINAVIDNWNLNHYHIAEAGSQSDDEICETLLKRSDS